MKEGDVGRRERRRERLQRGVIILPSAFTLGNLFFGLYAMVAASRGDLLWACWCIVFAAVLDTMDGRVARFTRTGSTFGSELDSLVDAVSFGAAPAFLAYLLYFSEGAWSWLLPFAYLAAVVVRLARFNVEQAGRAKSHFHGLPSPTGGMIVATFYPFSLTPLFETYLAALPWTQIHAVGIVFLGVLMLSHVPYPVVPRIGFRSARGLAALGGMLGGLVAALTVPRYFFFPFLALYAAWGFVKSILLGLVERLPERDPLRDEEPGEGDEAEAELREMEYADLAPTRFAPGPEEAPEGPDDEARAGAKDDAPNDEALEKETP